MARKKSQPKVVAFYIEEDAGEDFSITIVFEKAILRNPFYYGSAQYFVYALRCLICEHNRLYHEWDSPVISDGEYDALYKKLLYYEDKFPQTFHEQSPSWMVGGYSTSWPPPDTYRTDLFT